MAGYSENRGNTTTEDIYADNVSHAIINPFLGKILLLVNYIMKWYNSKGHELNTVKNHIKFIANNIGLFRCIE